MPRVIFGSAWPAWAMTYGTGASAASNSDMNVRRRLCGVTWPIGSAPVSPSVSLARSIALARKRLRTFSGESRRPVAVANTWSAGSGSRALARYSVSSSARVGVRSTSRMPVSVLAPTTRSFRAGRLTSRQRRSRASLIRSPARVRVARIGRRRPVSSRLAPSPRHRARRLLRAAPLWRSKSSSTAGTGCSPS